MKIYKRLSQWWDNRYGGEWRLHADFMMEAGDTLATAFAQLFAHYNEFPFDWPEQEGNFKKVHVTISISQTEKKELYDWDEQSRGDDKANTLSKA